jgi:hypothetical protein
MRPKFVSSGAEPAATRFVPVFLLWQSNLVIRSEAKNLQFPPGKQILRCAHDRKTFLHPQIWRSFRDGVTTPFGLGEGPATGPPFEI